MTKTKITSEDIFNRIREIEEDLLHIPITDHFLDITQEKGRLLSVYASLRIAEALEQNSSGAANSPDLPVVTTEKISGEKESRPSSLSAYSGNPSPLPGEKHRKNWEEILHEEKPSSPEKFSGERETLKKFDLDKINKVAHLLRDRFLLSGEEEKSEEGKKKLETINSYLKSYGFEEKDGILVNESSEELSPSELTIAVYFSGYLKRPEDSAHELGLLKYWGLIPVKEKIGEEEIENLAYLPEEKTEKE